MTLPLIYWRQLVVVTMPVRSVADEEKGQKIRLSAESRARQSPKDTRFKPGQSGNPRGRPKGAANFATVLQQQLRKTVTVAVEGKPRRMAAQEVIALRLTQESMKGSTKAMELLFRIAGAAAGDATDEGARRNPPCQTRNRCDGSASASMR